MRMDVYFETISLLNGQEIEPNGEYVRTKTRLDVFINVCSKHRKCKCPVSVSVRGVERKKPYHTGTCVGISFSSIEEYFVAMKGITRPITKEEYAAGSFELLENKYNYKQHVLYPEIERPQKRVYEQCLEKSNKALAPFLAVYW